MMPLRIFAHAVRSSFAPRRANVRTPRPTHWLLLWSVRSALVVGVAASVYANAMHAQQNWIARGIAAWAPLAFFAVVEILSHMPARRTFAAFVRFAGAAVVGGVAAWISYWHMESVASRFGEQYPYLLPLSVDGLIVVTSTSLFELKRRKRPDRANEPPVSVASEPAPAETSPVLPEDVAPPPARARRASRPPAGRGGRPARTDKAAHVAAVLSREKTAAAVARELKIEPRTVQKWVQNARAAASRPPATMGRFDPGPLDGIPDYHLNGATPDVTVGA